MPSPTALTTPAVLTTVTTATLAGGPRPNQDHIVVTDHAVAVLDGASVFLPHDPARDGGWYARALGRALTPLLVDDGCGLVDVVAGAIRGVAGAYGLTPGDCPSSTVTIARWTADALEVYALGDSPAAVHATDGSVTVVDDPRLDAVGAQQRAAYREYLRGGGGYTRRLCDLVAELQIVERRHRNTAGGYWIAEADPSVAARGRLERFVLDEVAAVLLLSDGASAAVTGYRLHDWTGVLDAVRRSPAGFLRDVHAAERDDPDGVRWPRAKRYDDKTLVLVERTVLA
jgi:hypothetical protein